MLLPREGVAVNHQRVYRIYTDEELTVRRRGRKRVNKLTWDQVENTASELADKVEESKFEPHYLVGITTGGLFPLALLAKRLKRAEILTVTARKNRKEGVVTVKNIPGVDFQGKTVLLVDEIAQSGKTLNEVAKILRENGAEEVKTATLAANGDVCEFWPDYYILIEKGDWTVFPWEKEEFPPYILDKQNQ